jgi:hypothetical protein
MTNQKETRTYKEMGFSPAAFGGLCVELKTEKGLFYVFGITADLSEIEYNYAETGDDMDYIRSHEVDLHHGEGFYEKTKPYLTDILKELNLDKRAAGLFTEWYKK